MNPSFEQLLKKSKKAILLGIGGGGDIVGTIPTTKLLELFNIGYTLGGLPWERSVFDPIPGPRKFSEINNARKLNETIWYANKNTTTKTGVRFAESGVSEILGVETLFININEGVNTKDERKHDATNRLKADLIIGIDVGGDAVCFGNEKGLMSPLADAIMTSVLFKLSSEIATVMGVFGFGSDGELTLLELENSFKIIAQNGGILGSWGITQESLKVMEKVIRLVPTEASKSPVLYAKGEFQNTKIRSGTRPVTLNLCSTVTFYLDPNVVFKKVSKPARIVANCKSIEEANRALNKIGIKTELDLEIEKFNKTKSQSNLYIHNRIPQEMKKILKKHGLLIGIIIGVVLGGIVGSLWPEVGKKFELLGKLFLDALKMIVLPLIIVSVTLSIMKVGNLGSLGLKTIAYYASTTAIAVMIGIVVVSIIHPGEGTTIITGEVPEIVTGKEDFNVRDIFKTLITPNLFKSAVEYQILPLIVISILFGIAFGKIGKDNQPVVKLFELLDKAIMMVVHWIIVLTPIGIFGLIAHRIGVAGGGVEIINLAMQIGKYVLSVLIGLFIHGFIVLPLILFFLTGRNPLEYIKQISEALLTAFSTASSSATLPLTMTNVIEGAKVSDRVGRFVLPLGATINMDGTALYEAVAVIFIAQSYGINLGGPELIIVFLTATLAAIGAAGIPEAGLVTMVLVLQSVGLPLEGIGLILAIDWLLDRFRTTINVWGDSIGAAVIDNFQKT